MKMDIYAHISSTQVFELNCKNKSKIIRKMTKQKKLIFSNFVGDGDVFKTTKTIRSQRNDPIGPLDGYYIVHTTYIEKSLRANAFFEQHFM